jgi:hypothetical protein
MANLHELAFFLFFPAPVNEAQSHLSGDLHCLAGLVASCLGQTLGHGFAQGRIDAGLPALPSGFEGFQHIGINPHIQGGALQGGCGPASAAFDVGLLPIGSYGGGIVGVIRPIGS